MALRFLTAGESHGPALTVIVEGLPSGITVLADRIDRELKRRMAGHGRGGRMAIESDAVEILGGVRHGKTLGSPVALVIRNKDHASWTEAMSVAPLESAGAPDRSLTRPRPGHADLAGALKHGTHDARDILERASARETAARVAAGGLAKALLAELGITVTSRTTSVGQAHAPEGEADAVDALLALPDDAPMRVLDPSALAAMIAAVDAARAAGDSIGGTFEVLARGVPPGLGSHVHWDRRLDGRLGGALLSIPAVKAVAIGDGVETAEGRGSDAHDPIGYDRERRAFVRPSNRAGGIEGGMTNGETVRARCYLKPLSTLPRALPSVDLVTKESFSAQTERTDTIPIVAAGVVGEAMTALVLADEALVKLGGDDVRDVIAALRSYRERLRAF
jgi:chorismate synthase